MGSEAGISLIIKKRKEWDTEFCFVSERSENFHTLLSRSREGSSAGRRAIVSKCL